MLNKLNLNWPSLETCRDYLKIIMYKIIKGLIDITRTPDLTPVLSVIRGHSHRFCVTSSQINCHLFSFIPAATRLWNSLPYVSHMVEVNSLEVFRRATCYFNEHSEPDTTFTFYLVRVYSIEVCTVS